MSLRDLDEAGLLLPREHWGHKPEASARTTVLTVFAAILGLASAVLIWVGAGGALTFLGIGLFLVDLLVFLVVTFQAVEVRMKGLRKIGADGPTVRSASE